jgi:quercetin dioxygenase-like cupin family protein
MTAPLVIIPPEGGQSFWQPVPANGFVRCILAAKDVGGETPFAMGTQTVAAGCFVREHAHPDNEEIIFVLEGSGEALINGTETHRMEKGACFFFGRGHTHRFQASDDGPLTFMWLMMPGGLETFFSRIGREKLPGDATPSPFPRPEDVLKIEAETVFAALPGKA